MKTTINELAVFATGSDKNEALIFVHGFPYDHTMWDAQVEALSSEYFCVTYDIRGLGESSAGCGQFTMESFVDDLEAVVDEMNLVKPALCGLSMGGYISLRTVERMESKFSKLILCDTRSAADNNEGKLKRAAGIKKIDTEGVIPFINEFIPTCFSGSYMKNYEKQYKEVLSRSQKNDPVGVKGSLLAMLSRTDTTESLKNISIPALIICGEEDTLTPPDVMKEMSHRISHSNYVEISGAGHMSPIEKSTEVSNHIKKFLKD